MFVFHQCLSNVRFSFDGRHDVFIHQNENCLLVSNCRRDFSFCAWSLIPEFLCSNWCTCHGLAPFLIYTTTFTVTACDLQMSSIFYIWHLKQESLLMQRDRVTRHTLSISSCATQLWRHLVRLSRPSWTETHTAWVFPIPYAIHQQRSGFIELVTHLTGLYFVTVRRVWVSSITWVHLAVSHISRSSQLLNPSVCHCVHLMMYANTTWHCQHIGYHAHHGLQITNKATVVGRLRPSVQPTISTCWSLSSSKIWLTSGLLCLSYILSLHPQNRKYNTYHNAVREGSGHGKHASIIW